MDSKIFKVIGIGAGVVAVLSVAAFAVLAHKTLLETTQIKLNIKKLKRDLGEA